MHTIFVLFSLSLLFSGFFSGCGSKQRNIFAFPEKAALTLHKLDFPVVKNVQVEKTSAGNKISWRPVDSQPVIQDGHTSTFVGYNVYRLARATIIPKKPINKKPIITTSLIDVIKTRKNQPVQPAWYLVRALFTINNQSIEGPISRIVSDLS